MMDDMSVRKVLRAVAPVQARGYIVPELKSNLLTAERTEALARFSSPDFKKTAVVIMGEPSADYKGKVQALMLADKKKKAQEEERKRLLEEKRKKAAEARLAKEAAQKRKEGKEVEEKKEEEPKEEAKEEAKM